jgi:hypothetical protein
VDWKLENIRILIADKTHRINGTIMRKILSNLLVIMVLSCAGCNLWITGKVVEAETEKPIQGAIVVAQWLQVRGLPFMGYHTVYKRRNGNRQGRFFLSAWRVQPFSRFTGNDYLQ